LVTYSQISALGPVDHCTSHFKRAVSISCRPCVDVHKGEGGSGPCGRMWTGGGGQNVIFCGRHKWMASKRLWTNWFCDFVFLGAVEISSVRLRFRSFKKLKASVLHISQAFSS